jgi:hypothetical protein
MKHVCSLTNESDAKKDKFAQYKNQNPTQYADNKVSIDKWENNGLTVRIRNLKTHFFRIMTI